MEGLLAEIRALREEVSGLRQDMRTQAQAAAHALRPLCVSVSPGEIVTADASERALGETDAAYQARVAT